MAEPGIDDVRRIVMDATGRAPVAVSRFTTGSHHYVFDVGFAEGPLAVLRLSMASERHAMIGALELSRLLRPLGVPLPEILAEDVGAPLPWLLLERLPGSDLGDVVAGLPEGRLDAVAEQVVQAQAIAARTPTAGRYGYAARPEAAPHATWLAVVSAHVERSRGRLAEAGLFDIGAATRVAQGVEGLRTELDAVPATPFLHDTTTKNVIVTADGAFSGIVDVDDLCFGDPRYAPALTLAAMMAHGLPTLYVDLWRRHAGWADDVLFRLYVAACLLDLMGEHGHMFNGNPMPSSVEARRRLESLFSEAVARLPE